ncbi:hypothetical protein F5Y04DRAFT_291466 [Hypomontagnella monticulosa]|nr:hypothetical protein F5Y04DRAFT_291466 [Hypomontagnella monticulosa]
MSKRENHLRSPGSFSSLSSQSGDAASIQPSAHNGDSTSRTSDARQRTTGTIHSAELPPAGRHSQSTSTRVANPSRPTSPTITPTPSTTTRRPKTATGSRYGKVRPKSKVLARELHRARAYEALTGAPCEPEEPPLPGDDHSQTQNHPEILRPGSVAPRPERMPTDPKRMDQSRTRIRSSDWKPVAPSYVLPTSNWETKSDSGADSTAAVQHPQRFSAYQPDSQRQSQQQQPQQLVSELRSAQGSLRGRPRPPPLNIQEIPTGHSRGDDARSDEYSNATYSFAPRAANPTPRSSVQSSRISSLIENYRRSGSYLQNQHIATQAYQPFRDATPSSPTTSQPERSPVSPARNSSYSSYGRGRSTHAPNHPLPQHSSINSQQPSPTPSFSQPTRAPTYASSRPAISRSPSPSWGAWTSEHPRAASPSFLDKARERVARSVHLNLQKAGMRPLSRFEVHSVVKTPTEDIASWSTRFTGPTRQPTAPGERVSVVSDGPGWGLAEMNSVMGGSDGGMGAMGRRRERRGAFGEGEMDYFGAVGDSVSEGGRIAASSQSTYLSELEGRILRYQQREEEAEEKQQQQQQSQRRRSSRDRTRTSSAHTHTTDDSDNDSLFLEGSSFSSPTSDTFFPSEYSQQQLLRQAQELVASLPPSPPFHQEPFEANRLRDSIGPDADFHVEWRSGLASESLDDREDLPSQSRSNSVASSSPPSTPIFVESPTHIESSTHHTLTRKKGTRNLR